MSEAIQRLIDPAGGLLDSLLLEHRATCDDRAKCPTEAWVAESRAAVVQLLADKKQQAEHLEHMQRQRHNEKNAARKHRKEVDRDTKALVAARDAAREHLDAERKRLPAGLKPLHGPDCVLCVAEPTEKQNSEQGSAD